MENLTRRSVLLSMTTALAAAPLLGIGKQLEAESTTGSLVFIGGYTDHDSKSLGVNAYRWDAKKGEMTAIGLGAATPNPSYIAIAKNRKTLYAVNEVDTFKARRVDRFPPSRSMRRRESFRSSTSSHLAARGHATSISTSMAKSCLWQITREAVRPATRF